MWTGGTVPTSADTVDLQLKGSDFKITLDVDATVADFDFGTDTYKDGKHTFVIPAGRKLTSTGQFNTKITASIIIEANATLIVLGSSTVVNSLTVAGAASFGGSSPSLNIDTQTLQSNLPVYATLTMNNGTITVANTIVITSTANLVGTGTILGTVQLKGTLQPGLEGKTGNLNITGDLDLSNGPNAQIYIDLKSETDFDHVYIGKSFLQNGNLYANPIDYTPLSHSEFVCFNHSSLRNGFDTVRQKGITHIVGNKWQSVPDQEYTALLYDSATTVFISFATIAACLVFTLL